MKWISIEKQMPELKHETEGDNKMSDAVLLWVLDTDGNGFPTVGNYSTYWGGWLADQDGPLHVWGFTVTHWAAVSPPPRQLTPEEIEQRADDNFFDEEYD